MEQRQLAKQAGVNPATLCRMESKPLEIGHHALSRRAISCSATWRSMTAVRRGIAEFLLEPDKYLRKPDIAIVMDGATWAQLYLNQTDLRRQRRRFREDHDRRPRVDGCRARSLRQIRVREKCDGANPQFGRLRVSRSRFRHVRFWHLADELLVLTNVCFAGKIGHHFRL
jgi:hypothetical protein